MFVLNSTLEGDSVPILENSDLLIRLVNDARYPWILIVPKMPNCSELHDLDEDLHTRTMSVVRKCGQVLKKAFNADKINTAAIGNMVPQLHIHVVARVKGDAAWPRPVWGMGEMKPLTDFELAKRLVLIREGLADLG
jgi:diadenosine tetraphosphate (Ap4A) HIT family hydrolase